MGNLYLKNVVTDAGVRDVLIMDGLFTEILPAGTDVSGRADGMPVLDASGKRIVPSFVNMHTHSAMTMMRGVGEDMSLGNWLDKVWRMEKHLNPDFIYYGTRLACLEMIKTGTAFFNDQYWMIDSAMRAVADSGMRAHLTYVMLDQFDRNAAARQRDECEASFAASTAWPEKIRFGISVHGVYTVSEENIVWAGEFASRHDLKLHVHLSETEKENADCISRTGMTPVAYLDSLGFLGENVIAAHSLWLTDKDIDILARRGVTVVHNVNSNLKLSSGYRFLYNELRDAGVRVTLGTDGCASSNNLDMLESMKTMALVQKAWRGDPAAMPLDELMKIASAAGYEALGVPGGSIREGLSADFILVDTDSCPFIPDYNFYANLVYSANSSCVDTLVCGGDVLMSGRKVENERTVLDDCRKYLDKFIKNI